MLKQQRIRQGNASMQTSYIRTDGLCMEFFYIKPNHYNSTLTVSVRGENFVKKPLLLVQTAAYRWRRKFVKLPPGVFRIIIEGMVSKGVLAGMAIDDLSIMPCGDFGKPGFNFVFNFISCVVSFPAQA